MLLKVGFEEKSATSQLRVFLSFVTRLTQSLVVKLYLMDYRLLFLQYKSTITMEVLIESPISLTESAIQEIKHIITEKNIPAEYGLRVGVKGGGCSGMSYVLGFDLQKENDNLYQVGDINIIMEKSHGMYLAGMEIDFVDGLNNRGFSFNNPNATKTCGCGTSFEA